MQQGKEEARTIGAYNKSISTQTGSETQRKQETTLQNTNRGNRGGKNKKTQDRKQNEMMSQCKEFHSNNQDILK